MKLSLLDTRPVTPPLLRARHPPDPAPPSTPLPLLCPPLPPSGSSTLSPARIVTGDIGMGDTGVRPHTEVVRARIHKERTSEKL